MKIIESFQKQEKPKNAFEWSENLKISQKLFIYITGRLQETGLLAEIRDDKNSSPTYIPAMDISEISVHTIYERFENLGHDSDFPVKINGDFRKIEELCNHKESEFFKTLDGILLKNYHISSALTDNLESSSSSTASEVSATGSKTD